MKIQLRLDYTWEFRCTDSLMISDSKREIVELEITEIPLFSPKYGLNRAADLTL